MCPLLLTVGSFVEAPVPGTQAFDKVTTDPDSAFFNVFHFFFHNAPDNLAELLTTGKEREYITHFHDRLVCFLPFASRYSLLTSFFHCSVTIRLSSPPPTSTSVRHPSPRPLASVLTGPVRRHRRVQQSRRDASGIRDVPHLLAGQGGFPLSSREGREAQDAAACTGWGGVSVCAGASSFNLFPPLFPSSTFNRSCPLHNLRR